MGSTVRVSDQVAGFVRSLAPEPRARLRAGIKSLADGAGDIKPLHGELSGWYRLRVDSFRVLFTEKASPGGRVVDCVYANRRSVVYDLFRELLRNELLGG
jgi:mRNA-degrading endonuclease RelE of RelBE toxin-antitoxin system